MRTWPSSAFSEMVLVSAKTTHRGLTIVNNPWERLNGGCLLVTHKNAQACSMWPQFITATTKSTNDIW